MKIVLTVVILCVIVLAHEFGHFLLAKANGIEVAELCIGFGPTIAGFTKGGTKYSIKAIPLGGACIYDMNDPDNIYSSSFIQAGPWRRLAVIAAGPIFNFILAFILSLFVIGNTGYPTAKLLDVSKGSPAEAAGLMAGDEITRMDSSRIHMFSEVSLNLMFTSGEPVRLEYLRDGVKNSVIVTPEYNEEYERYMFGITGGDYDNDFTPIKTLKYSAYYVRYQIVATLKSFFWLITGKVPATELSGPVGVASIVGEEYDAAKSSGALMIVLTMLNIAVLISANLGVINLLPLPALDGGRIFFILIELILRKPVPPEKEGIVHFVGVALLLLLTFYVLYNDIMRIVG